MSYTFPLKNTSCICFQKREPAVLAAAGFAVFKAGLLVALLTSSRHVFCGRGWGIFSTNIVTVLDFETASKRAVVALLFDSGDLDWDYSASLSLWH